MPLLASSCMVDWATTSLIRIPTYIQESVSATVFPDPMPTAKKKANLRECCRHVGSTLSTCQGQTQMSVVWGVKPTDTVSQDNGAGGREKRQWWTMTTAKLETMGSVIGHDIGRTDILAKWHDSLKASCWSKQWAMTEGHHSILPPLK